MARLTAKKALPSHGTLDATTIVWDPVIAARRSGCRLGLGVVTGDRCKPLLQGLYPTVAVASCSSSAAMVTDFLLQVPPHF